MKTSSSFATMRPWVVPFVALIFCTLSFTRQSSSQQQTSLVVPHPLITQPVDDSQLTVLKGNTHPLARPQFDLGAAPAALPMQRMLLVLKRSPEQESAIEKLLDDQQNKSSPSYHQWLTPAQFGQQFGPTDSDIQIITSWLQSHGFEVGAPQGRTVMEFSGSASQVQEAFHTTIHKYVVNGEQHWANSSDPQIPTGLLPAVAGVASLNNFPRRPMNRFAGQFSRDKATGKVRAVTPLFTYQPSFQCSADNYCFALGPYDFATIYNVLPLWNANINGTGQTIAIVGESNINPQDVANFRSLFGLPANSSATGNPLNIILNGPDPGLQGDESEADIDVQWSGAVAPYATIDFVVSQSTETTAGTDLSAVYIVDNNLAGVMSESYGSCELGLGTTGNQFYNSLWQQAAAQGITVFIAAGDNGAAGCDDFNAPSPAPAQSGLAVSGYASTPYNVAVGGTDFNEFTDPEKYWSVTNNSTTQASALGYIPETTWNDSCTNAIWETLSGLSQNPETNCNNSRLNDVVTGGGSGGESNCTSPTGSTPASCTGGYTKPSWQIGTGVPNDGKRDLPDVSLFASNGFAGSFYVICQSDQADGSCSSSSPDQTFLGFGGTSVSSPAFAGIMALVNQQTGARQGNANYVLYKLAAKDSLSSCNASSSPAGSCIFNDITSGTIAMPCATGSPNCTTSIAGDQYGILTGYNAGTGYDQATGLGSVNANNLVMQWSSVSSLPSATTLNSLTPTTITHGQPVSFSVTVKPQSGTGTPTGEISLIGGPSGNNNQGIAGFNLAGGTISGTTDRLPGGIYSVTAHYPGDSTYGPSDSSPTSVTVSKENSQPQVFLVTFDSSGNLVSPNTTTAVYGSPYLLRVNVEDSAGVLCTPVSLSGATGCPSGTVTMTDNGAKLDAGSYALNSYGYFEDQTVQLPGGTNSVKAAYAGDSSFNVSSATSQLNITQATTETQFVSSGGNVTVGQQVGFGTITTAQSSGIPPGGSVVYSANGQTLPGTPSYNSLSIGVGQVELEAGLTAAFASPGTYNVTAAYQGDGNYAVSNSISSLSFSARYTTTSSLSLSSTNPQPAAPVTLTSVIDTTVKNLTPTAGMTFSLSQSQSNSPVTGTFGAPASTAITDANGNSALQITQTYTPAVNNVTIVGTYAGDNNYSSSTTPPVSLIVAGTDFQLVIGPSLTITAPGVTNVIGVTVDGQSNYVGTINFSPSSCSGLPAGAACSFGQTPVTGSSFILLTVTTTAASATNRRPVTPNHIASVMLIVAFTLIGLLSLGIPASNRRNSAACFGLMLLALLMMLPSCGGGGNSGTGGGGGGGGGNDGTPPGTYPLTVTATSGSGSTAITHTATFNLIVQ
jgi:hypothetical protein